MHWKKRTLGQIQTKWKNINRRASANYSAVKYPKTGGGPPDADKEMSEVDNIVLQPRLGTPGLEGINDGLEIGGGINLYNYAVQ